MGNFGSYGAGGWVAMSLFMLLFWAGFIALVVWLVRAVRRPDIARSDAATRLTPADGLLAERFARGEIDDEEYQRRREFLGAAEHA